MKQAYIEKRFSVGSLRIIKSATSMVKKYDSFGKLTLLQLHDLLVKYGDIEHENRSYKRLQEILSKAKKSGLFDKYALAGRGNGIEDEKFERIKNGKA